jgi:hypothetical protein
LKLKIAGNVFLALTYCSFDHHELIAMIAPRALLMIESSQIPRMGAETAREVWKALGVPDRMGVGKLHAFSLELVLRAGSINLR